ncbi:MAG: hypothetical protein QM235_01655 [Pseudomonadota bacterium]|jgi:hypothetical protein|nr:hypothetical protein [Pseudomonadota bacterium]
MMLNVKVFLSQKEIDLAYDDSNMKIPTDIVLGGFVFKVQGTSAVRRMTRFEFAIFNHRTGKRFLRIDVERGVLPRMEEHFRDVCSGFAFSARVVAEYVRNIVGRLNKQKRCSWVNS